MYQNDESEEDGERIKNNEEGDDEENPSAINDSIETATRPEMMNKPSSPPSSMSSLFLSQSPQSTLLPFQPPYYITVPQLVTNSYSQLMHYNYHPSLLYPRYPQYHPHFPHYYFI